MILEEEFFGVGVKLCRQGLFRRSDETAQAKKHGEKNNKK
jgi:hypothetical protein